MPNEPRDPPRERFDVVRAAVRNRQVVLVLMAVVVAIGLHAILRMPRREDPEITIRAGLVIAYYPGASARQVEEQVATKIEQQLFTYAEVRKERTTTTSRPGVMIANVELNENVASPSIFWSTLRHDLDITKYQSLPSSVIGPIVDVNFGDVSAVLLGVRARDPARPYSQSEMSVFLDRIDDQIRGIPQVSKVSRFGEQAQELEVTINSARLAQFGVTASQVRQALAGRNDVSPSGTLETGANAMDVRTSDPFSSEESLGRLVVGLGRNGQEVALGNLATVTRRYIDPANVVRVDNQDAALMSIEMQEGNNIVDFGKLIDAKLATASALVPPDLLIERIADQPSVVQSSVLGFGREFLTALVAVILVTVLLLPLRVAAVAAVAIPVTVTATVALLEIVGIDLSQISFAGLVIALGMVVDDAIVIADNYVERLDNGELPNEACWRAASGLKVPVLVATLTIVASFLPIAIMIPGTTGQFIRPLPLTVTLALLSSYVVAMFLTPILCLAFVKTGVRPRAARRDDPGSTPIRTRRSPLDVMQVLYERVMAWAMPRKRLTIVLAAASVLVGVLLVGTRPARFFPDAERAQFVIDVWLPEGTRFAATDTVTRRIVAFLQRQREVANVASSTGAGFPRFYYNLTPEQSATNYAQVVVNTRDVVATPAFADRMHDPLARLAPEAIVIVRQFPDGSPLPAPVQIRYAGADPDVLQRLADSAKAVLSTTPGSEYVIADWHEDAPTLAVNLEHPLADRLGLSEGLVGQQLAGGLSGVSATTVYEGDRRIDVRLRYDTATRAEPEDLASAYLDTPDGARVPLAQIATVRVEWQPARIVRRNGIRTITVNSYARSGMFSSALLSAAQPRLDAIHLPIGYARSFGGEVENSADVSQPMMSAAIIAISAIFIVLFLQFRQVSYPLIIMCSIPLALFGSGLGLVLTGNPLSFTAELGLIALMGVVVRNAIILVDFILIRRRDGEEIEKAALDGGRERLRPIFLTTMAAAVGVVPMIVSRSLMWSPLASALAVGLLCSMVFTLVVVPVLYASIELRATRRASAHAAPKRLPEAVLGTLLVLLLVGGIFRPPSLMAQAPARGASAIASSDTVPLRLTLDEAIARALAQGHAVRAANALIADKREQARSLAANALPRLGIRGLGMLRSGALDVFLPAGALGVTTAKTPAPATDRIILSQSKTAYAVSASVQQPITQLFRIHAGVQAAEAAAEQAATQRDAVAQTVALGVERAYFAAVIAERERDAARATLESSRASQVVAVTAIRAGTTLGDPALEARAAVLKAEANVLTADDNAEDALSELRALLGLPLDTPMLLVEPPSLGTGALETTDTAASLARAPMDTYLASAREREPTLASARARAAQARASVRAAHASYIPEVSLVGSYLRQDIVSFLQKNDFSASVVLNWTALDFGQRRHDVESAQAQELAAIEDLARLQDSVLVAVEQAYRAVTRAERQWAAAAAAAAARHAAERTTMNQWRSGFATMASARQAEASSAAADAHSLAAELNLRLAEAELRRASGMLPWQRR